MVLLGIALIRLLWFQGNVLADGDLLIPIDAPGYLGERPSTWNTVELGMASGLVARLLNPLMVLLAVSQMTAGSAVFGEAAYVVLFTFLSGVSVWWLADYLSEGRKSTLSLLVTSIFYASSTFLINDGLHTAILFLHTYALIPLIVYLLLRAAREGRGEFVVAASFLSIIIASTMPNFKDLAFLAIVLALFFAYGIISKTLDRSSWRALGKFLLYSTLLNLAWILPMLVNLNYWAGGLDALPVTRVTDLSVGLGRIFQGIGKWAFDSGYQGLLYHPYSIVYSSPPFILLGYSISILAFASLVLARPKRPALFMASFTLLFLFISKGSQAPFGGIYSGAVLLGPLRAFRESFHFFQFAALGYAYLLGEFVDATRRYLHTFSAAEPRRGGRSLLRGLGQRRVTAGVSVLLISLIVVNSWPLHTGAIAVNWYAPDTHGVKFPPAYQEAATWLEQKPQLFRLIILPELGNYIALRWGFQGGSDLFHGLFQQPVIVGSSWSEFVYPTRGQVSTIYEAARANDTETFRGLAYWFSIRFALLDESRDGDFYPELPISYYEEFLLRAGFHLLRQFDSLRVYEFPAALPIVYAADTILNQNSSIQNPSGVTWSQTNFRDGWRAQPSLLEIEEETTHVGFLTNSSRAAFPLILNPSVAKGGGYLLIKFATNSEASIVVAARTPSPVYLYALNPPRSTLANHYQSLSPYVLAFPLPTQPVTAIQLFVTNRFAPAFSGVLELWLYSVSLAADIGRPLDVLSEAFPPGVRAASISSSDFDRYGFSVQEVSPSTFTSGSASQTRHEVRYSSVVPFLLVLNEGFSTFWQASVDGTPIISHIRTNNFSNGWLIPAGEDRIVILSYGLQDYFVAGLSIAAVTAILLLLLVAVTILQRLFKSDRGGDDES